MAWINEFNLTHDDVVVIGAMAANGVIGQGDGMPWNVPVEYQHFVETVRGQCVVIGRRSYEIFGGDFAASTFVLSRSTEQGTVLRDDSTVVFCLSLADALQQARLLRKPIFIAGGRSLYAMAFDVANRMLLSTIKGDFAGDTYFPDIPADAWSLFGSEDRGPYVLNDWRRTASSSRTSH